MLGGAVANSKILNLSDTYGDDDSLNLSSSRFDIVFSHPVSNGAEGQFVPDFWKCFECGCDRSDSGEILIALHV